MKDTQLDAIRRMIKRHGPTAISKRTSIARRTLQYIASGRFTPSYDTFRKLERAAYETEELERRA